MAGNGWRVMGRVMIFDFGCLMEKKSLRSQRLSGKIGFDRRGAEDAEGGCSFTIMFMFTKGW